MRIVLISILIAALLSGCFKALEATPDPLPATPQEQVFKIIQGTDWLFTLTVLGVGAGFFAFLNGSGVGLQIMASCFVVLSIILGVARYSTGIAMISVVGAVALLLYTILAKSRALKEVVKGVQAFRDDAGTSNGLLEKVNGYLKSAQSPTTESIVKQIKGK